MALVQLADIIVPEFFAEYMALSSMTSAALFQSGPTRPDRTHAKPPRETVVTIPGAGAKACTAALRFRSAAGARHHPCLCFSMQLKTHWE
jgi:hypothetical protein